MPAQCAWMGTGHTLNAVYKITNVPVFENTRLLAIGISTRPMLFPTPPIVLDPPSCHSIVRTYHQHTTYNTLPFKVRFQHLVEHVDIFRLFLTKSLLEDMAANTNPYAAAKAREQQLEGGWKWKEVYGSELEV